MSSNTAMLYVYVAMTYVFEEGERFIGHAAALPDDALCMSPKRSLLRFLLRSNHYKTGQEKQHLGNGSSLPPPACMFTSACTSTHS